MATIPCGLTVRAFALSLIVASLYQGRYSRTSYDIS